jgi:transposase
VSVVEDLLGLWNSEAKLSLSARVFQCETCGISIDRDLNAARNLAALVNKLVAGSGPET